MSNTGTWFVLCDAARAIPPGTLAERFASLKHATVLDRGGSLTITVHDSLTGRDAQIDVGFSSEPHVAIEAREIAERHGRPELSALHARYELVWDLRMTDEVYNTLAVIAEKLETACGGVIYDVTEGRFV